MVKTDIPEIFLRLMTEECIMESDIEKTEDGFFLIYKSLADILAKKDILDLADAQGERILCSSFFDDWFLYAVASENGCVYSLLKLREQEYDAANGIFADGDTPGVTVSFISFDTEALISCLAEPTDLNRQRLSGEISRVVSSRGQRHSKELKRYFADYRSKGAYLTASVYVRYIAALAVNGCLNVPECYGELYRRSIADKSSSRAARIPRFIEELNRDAGRTVCDNERIFIKDSRCPDGFECAAILATHTGNTSVYSFAAEVEYHARFLIPLLRIKLPFFGKSLYDSAIRADMTIDGIEHTEFAPFYKDGSRVVKKHRGYHQDPCKRNEEGV